MPEQKQPEKRLRSLEAGPEMVLQALKLALAPVAWRTLRATVHISEFQPASRDEGRPLIFACLHRDILMAIMHVRPAKPSLLVSKSPDGDILIKTLGQNNYGFVRGATGEDGKRAFVALRRELEQGRSIGLAVDGPKGPYGVINEGVLQLSRLSGAPIVPLLAEAPRSTVLNTWDRTVVPHLFSGITMHRGSDQVIRRDSGESELATVRQQLADFFKVQGGSHADS